MLKLAAGAAARVKVMSCTSMRIGALFNRGARETLEMSYQHTAPCLFDSGAFERAFGISATPITDGIAHRAVQRSGDRDGPWTRPRRRAGR